MAIPVGIGKNAPEGELNPLRWRPADQTGRDRHILG